MNGANDYTVPPANARYIAARIGKNARLELDAGGRHGWFIEHPAHFQTLMANFLG
jgi:pimeloyl-ACP methyl ester carboxylesterase